MLYRPLEAQSSAVWGQAQLMGLGAAWVGVKKGDTRRDSWWGSLSKAVELERTFMRLCSNPFLSTYCVPYAGLLATELNRTPMKGSPKRSLWAEICWGFAEWIFMIVPWGGGEHSEFFWCPRFSCLLKGAGFYSLIAYGPVTYSPWVSVSLSVK